MCAVRLNELTAVLKVSAHAGQSGAVNRTSVELTVQDDFQEVKKRKRNISNDTSQTAKMLSKSVPKSAAVKLSPKAVITRKFFAPLRITGMDTETTGAENTTGAGGFQKIRQAATISDDFYHKPHSTPKRLKLTRQRRERVPIYT
jgi:hypothetical protein